MPNDWKNDPRLKSMNPEKLQVLSDFAEQIRNTPKDQMMSALAALNLTAREKNIQFSDQETDLLASILTANLNPSERKKLDTMRLLLKKKSR